MIERIKVRLVKGRGSDGIFVKFEVKVRLGKVFRKLS